MVKSIAIYIDADACPVKQEVYRVAERHALKGTTVKVYVVSNSPIAVPRDIFVGGRPDCSPPPCGEGLGVGVGRRRASVDECVPPHDPHPTLPTRGREQSSSPLSDQLAVADFPPRRDHLPAR